MTGFFVKKKVGRRSGRFDPAVKSDDLLFFFAPAVGIGWPPSDDLIFQPAPHLIYRSFTVEGWVMVEYVYPDSE